MSGCPSLQEALAHASPQELLARVKFHASEMARYASFVDPESPADDRKKHWLREEIIDLNLTVEELKKRGVL